MRLNGNQIAALNELFEEGFFHFDILGTDPLDNRVVSIKAWSFDYSTVKLVFVNENGTVFEEGI